MPDPETLRRHPSGPRVPAAVLSTRAEIEEYPIYAYLQRSLSCGSADSYASTMSIDSLDSSINVNAICSLRRRPHIRRAHRRKFRPLPPRPSSPVIPELASPLSLPSLPSPKVRRLPVPPLPMNPFPAISPTRCTTPAPSFPINSARHQSYAQIDWEIVLSEIMNSTSN